MQIALLSWESKHSISVGGLAEHVSELAAALVVRGHEMHIFTRMGAGQSPYDLIDGVHYHRCPFEPHDDFFIANQRMCDSFVWHLAETESHLARPFDIVHGHDWLSVHALTRIKNELARPAVMTVHSTEFGRCGNRLWDGPSRRVREQEWAGTYVAERVICVSGALLREVQHLYSVPADKMHVIYNGVDVSRFDEKINTRAQRRRHKIGMDDPLVLFAGRMTRQKGPDILVEAVPQVLAKHPDTKFVFAGEGDMRGGLESRISHLGLESSTRFVGYQSGRDLVGLFKSADVVCVPSRNEPFGIVILEAWSARKPVVSTRNGGPGEFVNHQATGLTVSDDHDSIGCGLGMVLADKPLRRRLGRNGRREAESRFSWNTIGAATERVYASVLESRSGSQRIAPIKERLMATRKHSNKTGRVTTSATKRQSSAASETSKRSMTVSQATAGMQTTVEQIRQRAYELYVARGDKPGDAQADWLQAENELNNR